MQLVEKTWQSGNDFDGIFVCEHCDTNQFCRYCYNDERFFSRVIPAIKCVSCGKRSSDIIPEGISDPGTQGGVKVTQKDVIVQRWVSE